MLICRPSQYAIFESIAPPGKKYITWEDMWTAKRTLDQLKEAGEEAPFLITDAYLKKSFVYQLMQRCEDSKYEGIVRDIFQIVCSFSKATKHMEVGR